MDWNSEAARPEDGVTRWGEFASAELEAAYRQHHTGTEQLLGRVIIAVAAVTSVALSGRDFDFYPLGDWRLHALIAARWGHFALSAVALGLLWGRKSPARFALVFAGWNAGTALLPLTLGTFWPAGHIEPRMSASIAVLMSYCIMPQSLRLQTVSALSYTATHLLVIVWLNPLDDRQAIFTEVGWLVLINVLGYLLSYRLHSRQRHLFAALRRQAELSGNLGRALAEVRTLRGLIRVCAWCRKVDTGEAWQQLESYVRAHSHAEFTHGICPTCLCQATAGFTEEPAMEA